MVEDSLDRISGGLTALRSLVAEGGSAGAPQNRAASGKGQESPCPGSGGGATARFLSALIAASLSV